MRGCAGLSMHGQNSATRNHVIQSAEPSQHDLNVPLKKRSAAHGQQELLDRLSAKDRTGDPLVNVDKPGLVIRDVYTATPLE